MSALLEFYRGREGDHRWRVVAPNGRKLANGGEGYRRMGDMAKALLSAREALNETEHLPRRGAGPQAGSAEGWQDGISAPTPAADAEPDASPGREPAATPRRRRGPVPGHYPAGA